MNRKFPIAMPAMNAVTTASTAGHSLPKLAAQAFAHTTWQPSAAAPEQKKIKANNAVMFSRFVLDTRTHSAKGQHSGQGFFLFAQSVSHSTLGKH